MPLGTSDTPLGGHEYADLILGPLLATSKVLRHVRTLETSTTNLHVPTGKAATVTWVPEHQPIPESTDLVDEIVLTPKKAAALATVSNELIRDSSPAAQQVLGDILVRSVANAVDAAFFNGTGADGQPAGITTVTSVVTAGTPTLEGLAGAVAAIEANGGTASVAWMRPDVWASISADLTTHPAISPVGEVQRSLLGVTVETIQHAPAGTVFVADGQQVVAAVRTDGEVDVSGEARFATYQTQIRVVSRIDYGFPTPGIIARLANV